jgi:hypothetical protein
MYFRNLCLVTYAWGRALCDVVQFYDGLCFRSLYSTRTSTILRSSFNLGGLIPWTGTGSGKSTRASEGSEMTGPGSTGNSESDKGGKV